MSGMTLDVLMGCLERTVAAGRAMAFSPAAQRSRRHAEGLLAALAAMAPDEEPEAEVERVLLFDRAEERARARLERASRDHLGPGGRMRHAVTTEDALVVVLEDAGRPLSPLELMERLPNYSATAVRSGINRLRDRQVIRNAARRAGNRVWLELVRAGGQDGAG